MISYNAHGGDCCGVTHIFGFPVEHDYIFTKFTEERKVRILENLDNVLNEAHRDSSTARHPPHLYEIILNKWQLNLEEGFLKKHIEQIGFEQVNDFINGNTNNNLYVYHWIRA